MRTLIVTAAAALSLASAAYAQTATTTAPATTTTAPAANATGMANDGMQMTEGTGLTTTKTSTVAVHFIAVKPTDALVSHLLGVNVYNNQNESMGEIEDFVINDGKTISAVVLGVGGFLGMGERYVAVSPSNIVLHRDNNSFKAMLNTSKDDLKKAPTFDYSKRKAK